METKKLIMINKYQITPLIRNLPPIEQVVKKLQQQGVNAKLCKRLNFKGGGLNG